MRRFLVSILGAAIILTALPVAVDAQNFRSLMRHTIGAPASMLGGLMGFRPRHAARHRHARRIAARTHRGTAIAATTPSSDRGSRTLHPLAAAPASPADRPEPRTGGLPNPAVNAPAPSNPGSWPS